MKIAKILAALTAVGVMGTLALAASAEELPAGYVTFAAEKTTIGQGFVTEPVSVPFYDGDNGIDIAKRAADVIVTESDYGDYITAFADVDNGGEIPAEIAAVCPQMTTERIQSGYLSAMDYTAEAGWNYYVNDEAAMVGISGYTPADGDVVCFKFTVYGYGADLGADNSSWGGAAALITPAKTAELMKLLAANAELSDTDEYTAALDVLSAYNPSQTDVDEAFDAVSAYINAEAALTDEVTVDATAEVNTETPADTTADKGSPDTGVSGIAAVIGVTALAGVLVLATKKR